jgi:hypothetical protein
VPGLVPLREGSRGTMVGHPTLASATCSEGEAPAPPPQQLIPAHIVADKTTARLIRAGCLNISLPVYRPSFLSRLTASTRPTSRQAIPHLSRPTAPDPCARSPASRFQLELALPHCFHISSNEWYRLEILEGWASIGPFPSSSPSLFYSVVCHILTSWSSGTFSRSVSLFTQPSAESLAKLSNGGCAAP